MKVVIEVIIYGINLLIVYLYFIKIEEGLMSNIQEIRSDWLKVPNWLNWFVGILIFIACIIALKVIYFYSLIIWLILLIIVPFFYLPITNSKIFNFLSVSTFFLTTSFSVILFIVVDYSRDLIGENFISNYEVGYTTEIVQLSSGDVEEVEVAHVNTGDSNLDFILEFVFPIVYRMLIGFVVILSLLLNISLRKKNKLIRGVP